MLKQIKIIIIKIWTWITLTNSNKGKFPKNSAVFCYLLKRVILKWLPELDIVLIGYYGNQLSSVSVKVLLNPVHELTLDRRCLFSLFSISLTLCSLCSLINPLFCVLSLSLCVLVSLSLTLYFLFSHNPLCSLCSLITPCSVFSLFSLINPVVCVLFLR